MSSQTMCGIKLIAVLLTAALTMSSARAGDPPASLLLRNCSEQNIVLLYPAALYRKLLPLGFSFPAPGLTAQILVSGSSCEAADGSGPSSELLSFMEVVPSARYRDPSVPVYAIALAIYTTRPETVAVFGAAGFDDVVQLGKVSITSAYRPFLHERNGTVVAGNADGQIITSTTTFGPITTVPASHTRLFAVRDGAVVGMLDGEYTEHPGYGGVGTLLKFGGKLAVAPLAATLATQESGYDLLLRPVPLPAP